MNRGLEFEPVACSVHNPVRESRLETPAGGFYKAVFKSFLLTYLVGTALFCCPTSHLKAL